ncbi:LexA family transcriptional regulator [bacterium]|nr:LexA family transcriptional regulator [bacterium]
MATHGEVNMSGQDSLARSAGLLLRVLRMRAGLDQAAIAQSLQVSQSRVSRWERGQGLPDSAQLGIWLAACRCEEQTAQELPGLLERAGEDNSAAVLGLRRLLLSTLGAGAGAGGMGGVDAGPQAGTPGGPQAGMAESYDTSVPYFAAVAAGLGEVQAPRYGPQAHIPVPADVLRRDPGAYALRVRGDSMLPLLAEGDIVVVSPRAAVFEGCIVAARVDPDGDVVKQYRRLPDGRVQLVPLNSAYPLVTLRAAREAISALADLGLSVPPDALEREGQEGQLWGRVVLQLREL